MLLLLTFIQRLGPQHSAAADFAGHWYGISITVTEFYCAVKTLLCCGRIQHTHNTMCTLHQILAANRDGQMQSLTLTDALIYNLPHSQLKCANMYETTSNFNWLVTL